MAPVSAIPPGYHSVTAYLTVRDCVAALAFYEHAFGAVKTLQMDTPDGKVAHAEIRIGDSIVMLAEEMPEWGNKSPATLGGSPVLLLIYLPDVDAAFARALAAGGKEIRPLADQFYGDRSGTLVDPFGHRWTLATHVEDVSEEEVKRRMAQMQ